VPPDISAGAAHTRIVAQEFRDDIKDIKSEQKSDFRIVLAMFGAGFVILGGMLFVGYFRLDDRMGRLEDKVNATTSALVRIDTKLEDLLARIPPTQTPAPARRP
jgi:hypothetical protein